MTRAGLKGAIEWAKVADVENGAARVYANALALLIEAAEAHLKTMPEAVMIYIVTAVYKSRLSGAVHATFQGYNTREDADRLAAEWGRDNRYHDVKITEIVSHG